MRTTSLEALSTGPALITAGHSLWTQESEMALVRLTPFRRPTQSNADLPHFAPVLEARNPDHAAKRQAGLRGSPTCGALWHERPAFALNRPRPGVRARRRTAPPALSG